MTVMYIILTVTILLTVYCEQAADLAREAMMLFSASEAGKAVLEDIRMFGGIDNTVETSTCLLFYVKTSC